MIEGPEQQPDNREHSAEPRRPDFADPARVTEMISAAPDAWSRGELEREPAVPPRVPRDRILSPRVLIGWATLTLVAYFGIHFVSRIVRESVRQAVVSSVREVQGASGRKVEILLPNGKRILISPDPSRPSGPPVIQSTGGAGADADPDLDVTVVPPPATTTGTKGLPGTKALPAAKAPSPAQPKTSATRR